MLLTSRIVRAARPRERRYVLADEHGMSLHVMPRGSKWWRFRYRFQHAERMISLGVYPSVNLATARLLHADARGLLARDIDPSAADHLLSSFRPPGSRLPPRVTSSGRGLDAMRVQNRGE